MGHWKFCDDEANSDQKKKMKVKETIKPI